MPEIPEMETLRQHLLANCINKKVIQIKTIREKTFNLPLGQINNLLENRTITNVLRKGKIIIIQFDNNSSLYFHLMLDGFLKFTQPNEKLNPDLQDKYQLRLNFASQEKLFFLKMYLGYIKIIQTLNQMDIPELAELGPDPIANHLSLQDFKTMLIKKRKMIKPLLMEQNFISGIGNTYSNEGLFLGQVLPNRKASELSEKEVEKLYYQLNILLKEAIKQGGTGQIPFSSTDKITGGYRQKLKVSYREGEPCFVCGNPITYQKIGGRNAFYCHFCQH